ncbi:MAG TPA: alpha/beta hydrolase [Ktedonobacteraceae bacterium]
MATEQNPPAVSLDAVSHRFVEANGLRIHYAEMGSGPLVLLCHGFPELWYSWRYQLPALARAGYHAIAPDLRGYGQTDQPADIASYTLLHLVGDLVGLLDALGEQQAILISHDWGGNLAWHAALLRPDRFPALVVMSVPYVPRAPLYGEWASVAPTQSWRRTFKDQTFYQLYFQEPGVAEVDLARDVRATLLRFLYGASGDVPPAKTWRPVIPNDQGNILAQLALPAELPVWLTEADIAYYTAEFTRTGFSGGLNWYRNIDRNWELLAAYSGAPITRPALFLWGDRDPSLALPGIDKRIARMEQVVPNLRTMLLSGSGHWVQQVRAQEVNMAILAFLKSLE